MTETKTTGICSDYSESKTQLVLTSWMVQYMFPKHAIEQTKFMQLVELVRGKIALRNR